MGTPRLRRQLTEERGVILMTAFAAHPHRFKSLAPKPPVVPTAAWINPPTKEAETPEISIPRSPTLHALCLKVIDCSGLGVGSASSQACHRRHVRP
jgi:hypothetical protein